MTRDSNVQMLEENIPAGNNTVLVVEDDAGLRFVISDRLRDAGFTVFEAGDATEALKFLHTPHDVALVFCDVVIPGHMDGITFAQKLRQEYPSMKIILTTGKVPRDSLPADILLIPKPYILARVISEIRRMLAVEKKNPVS